MTYQIHKKYKKQIHVYLKKLINKSNPLNK